MPTITKTTTTTTITRTVAPAQRPVPARGWLKSLGWILLVLGVLGLVPAVTDVTHGYGLHLEGVLAALHWVVGLAALVCAYGLRRPLHHAIAAIALGVVLLAAGAAGFAGGHAGLGDNLLHLVLGTVTLLVGVVSFNRVRETGRQRAPAARAA